MYPGSDFFFYMKAFKADGVVLMQHQRDSPKGEPFEFSNGMLTLSIHHALSTLRRMSWYLSLDRMLYWISIESPFSHQQLLTNIPSSLPTSSNGFFIEIYKNIIKVAFFIEDDIRALEHENVCKCLQFPISFIWSSICARFVKYQDVHIDNNVS